MLVMDKPKAKLTNGRRNSAGDVRIERVVVTPDIASAWLDKNDGNRKVSKNHVERLSRDMLAQNFKFTGDAIRFDDKGGLIDGQHRLMACIKSGASFETQVIYGLPRSTQDFIDSGKSRNASDVLSLAGFHCTHGLAAAARLLMAERDGTVIRQSIYSTSDVVQFIAKHKALPASIIMMMSSKRVPRGVSASQVAAVHYIGKHVLGLPNVADAFVDVISTGVPDYTHDAAHAYRERMIKASAGVTVMKKPENWRLMKHAWNLFARKEASKVLRGSETVTIEGLNKNML